MHLPLVIADNREIRSGIVQTLRKKRLSVQVRTLDVGDYVIGGYAVERKTTRDFLNSLYDGRLFEQAQRISSSYNTYLLVVEGDIQQVLDDLKNPRVFWGTILSLALKYGFKIFFTLDRHQTSELLLLLANKLTREGTSVTPILANKPKMGTIKDWQLKVVESLPTISPKLAEQLLRNFGDVRRIFEASTADLAVKGGIGPARAARISTLLDAEFRTDALKQMKLVENNRA